MEGEKDMARVGVEKVEEEEDEEDEEEEEEEEGEAAGAQSLKRTTIGSAKDKGRSKEP